MELPGGTKNTSFSEGPAGTGGNWKTPPGGKPPRDDVVPPDRSGTSILELPPDCQGIDSGSSLGGGRSEEGIMTTVMVTGIVSEGNSGVVSTGGHHDGVTTTMT